MTLTIPIPLAKEAAPKVRSGSYADGMAVLESWERLVKSTSSALSQNKRSICLCFGRRSVTSALESAQNFMKIKIRHKDKHFFRNCKLLRFRTANPTFAVPNPLARPFGSANGSFPYEISAGWQAADVDIR